MRGRLLGALIVGTLAFGIALGLNGHERALATAAYLDFVCAVLVLASATVMRSLGVSGAFLGRARRPRPQLEQRPAQLQWVDRQLGSAQTLRPLVTQIAAVALERGHGVVSEREPERARALVGEQVWALIDPAGAQPSALPARTRRDELERLVADLEALA